MRQLLFVFFAVLLMVGGGEDLSAKTRSRSVSRPKTVRTTETVKPKPAPKKTVKKAPKKTRTEKKSTIKKTTTSKKEKPKAVSQNKMDRKQSKAQKSKNTAAGKKYGTKANASKAYKGDMAKKHTSYKSATPPTTRPASVPRTVVVVAGQPGYAVGYHPFGGGMYGYGYMDPMSGLYVRLAAAQMIANDAALMNAGYGHYGPTGTPVVYGRGTGFFVLWTIIGLFVIVLIIVVIKKVTS